jgi:Flp pilus assembly protein TadG
MVVLWLLGVSTMLLMLGGLSIDLWHVFSERRALVGAADAAAYAGASGIDLDAYRRDGTVRLGPAAEELARASLAGQGDLAALAGTPAIAVAPERVTVVLEGRVELTLLRLLAPGTDALDLRVSASAEPRLG